MLRDVIWTLIIIWLIYKLVNIFKGSSKKSFAENSNPQQGQNQQDHSNHSYSAKKDTKEAIQKSADKEGDYVDFEEIK
ncbi:MAG: DUF4834 family protein [Bacteroidetes bacterium]|nr:DUF4834 family protein [Bacteroidota bacterium]